MSITNAEQAKAKRAAYMRDYLSRNREKLLEYKKQWWLSNREQILPKKRIKSRERYRKNREMCLRACRESQKRHPETGRRAKAKWLNANRERFRKISRDWHKKHSKNDPIYRIKKNLRNRIRQAIARRGKKCAHTVELLGCSIPNFRIYLESKFEPGMSWDNYGRVWHLDHIMPCAIFDLSRPEHQKRCFHFSNIQPLFALDNRLKKDNAPSNHQFQML